MAIEIKGLGAYLPERVMKNDDWREYFETSDEWIYSHTGIKERHILSDEQSTVDLAYQAAKRALEDAKMTIDDIDMIIVATSSPDYVGFPATANLLQGKLGATKTPSFDIRAACTGFIYGLNLANGLLSAGGVRNVLVVGAEALTRIMDWSDRSTAVLFGDGAGAVVVGQGDQDHSSFIDFALYSKGNDTALLRPLGGTKKPLNIASGNTDEELKETYLKMDGQAVYQFAVRSIGEVVEELLARNKLTLGDIDYIVPHQANRRILEAVCGRKKWPIEKFFLNMDKTANTSAASIPLALGDMRQQNLLKKGQKLILVGFGAGLTWGGCLVEW